MTLGGYLNNYINDNDLSIRAFSRLSGVSHTYLTYIINGKTGRGKKPKLTIDIYNKIAKAMGKTVDEIFSVVDDEEIAWGESGNAGNVYQFPANVFPIPEGKQIPLLGTVPCGAPVLAEENIDEIITAPANVNADFALRCKGDSMINARIFDGDIVYIRQQSTVEDGEIAAVIVDRDATLKRVYQFRDHIILAPENPKVTPLVFWEDDMDDIHIIGKAVAFTSMIR